MGYMKPKARRRNINSIAYGQKHVAFIATILD